LETDMDLRKLKTLIDLVSDSNISELEITEAEGKVRIVKADPRIPAPVQAPVGGQSLVQPVVASPAPVEVPPPPAAGHPVKSPMVGTFYRSATPGGKPLVEVGDKVQAGQAVCIIEAMKIMNEIESDHAGTVTQVLVDDGRAVEFGQPLFIVE
jgi:acetyl-CoA carboxylase biotin carboxyl carrier protein